MRVVRKLSDLATLEGTVGFVPTMGALHEGHLSLIRASKLECDHTVISIFVNPLQFGPNEDLSKYPRSEAQDLELIERAGGDVTFVPTAEELLPTSMTTVHVEGVSNYYEGERRPGHFDGVATIVCKLFNLVRPTHAFFGLKDRQQCAVISQMVSDLNIPIRLEFRPTIRESDGLAMSSRNAYLSTSDRATAPLLFKYLEISQLALLNELEQDESRITDILATGSNALSNAGFVVDYFDLVDESTFTSCRQVGPSVVLIAAAKLGATRLIDNIAVMAN